MPYEGTGQYKWEKQNVRCRYFNPNSEVDDWGDPDKMQGDFLLRLDEARHQAGVPFIINSAHRGSSDTSHGRGWGVDIKGTNGRVRWKIVQGLLAAGFNRIGVYDLHVHADSDPQRPPRVMWGGKSQ